MLRRLLKQEVFLDKVRIQLGDEARLYIILKVEYQLQPVAKKRKKYFWFESNKNRIFSNFFPLLRGN